MRNVGRALRRHVGRARRAFSPLNDADTVGVWLAADAFDVAGEGTGTLSVPNRVSGGAVLERQSAGRPLIDADGLDGTAVGLDFGSATAALQAAVGAAMSGGTEATLLVHAQDAGTTAGYLARYGTGFQNFWLLYNSSAARRFQSGRQAVEGIRTVNSRGRDLIYPRTVVYRANLADAAEDSPAWVDGAAMPEPAARTGPADTSGGWHNGILYIGARSDDAAPFKGRVGGVILVRRALSDAEVRTWSAWLSRECGFPTWRDVMWVGDSITAHTYATYAHWRSEIQGLYDAESAGVGGSRWYRPVGPFSPAGTTWARDFCFGVSGGTTVTTLAGLATYEIGTRYQPQVVPVLLGTNDLATETVATLRTRYLAFISALSALLPNALIVAMKLLPRTDVPATGAKVTDWNANYHEGVVAELQAGGVNVISDDTFATLGGLSYVDGLHVAAASGPAMAAAIYPRLKEWVGVA